MVQPRRLYPTNHPCSLTKTKKSVQPTHALEALALDSKGETSIRACLQRVIAETEAVGSGRQVQ